MHAGLLFGFTIAPHRSKDQAKHSRAKLMQSTAGKAQEGKAQAKHSRQGAAGQSTGKAQQAKHTRAKHRQSTGKAQQAKHSRRNKAQQAKHRQSIVGKSYLFQSSQTVAAKDCKKTLSYTAASQQSAFCQSCPLADPPQSSSSVKSQCCRPSLIFFTP